MTGSRSLGDLALDAGVAAFAFFTLCTNATVALGGSLSTLALSTPVAAALAVGWSWWLSRGSNTNVGSLVVGSKRAWRDGLAPAEMLALCVLSLAGAGASWLLATPWPAWLGIVAVASWVMLRAWPVAPGFDPASNAEVGATARSVSARGLVFALALVCAVTVAVSHRANEDDAFYLNIAVAAADAPGSPLLAGDTLHGYEDVPFGLPVFRVLAYEPAIAVLSSVGGVDALVLAHVVLPPLFAALIPFAWRRLLRRLAPREWPWLLIGVVVSFFLFADGRSTHGEFALLRLQQGKSILLVVLWPLLAEAGMAFGRSCDVRSWGRLALAQIAAVGLTTNALWLAPVVGGLGVCAGLLERAAAVRGDAEGPPKLGPVVRTLALGGLASLHPVGVALGLRGAMLEAFHGAPHPLPSLEFSATRFMAEAIEIVAGQGLAAAWTLFVVASAMALAPTAALRRFLALYTAATALLFWSPLFAAGVATQITGPDTYFRVLWLWPVPLAFAVVFTAGVPWLARMGHSGAGLPWLARMRQSGAGFAVAAAASFTAVASMGFVLGGQTLTISPANDVRLGAPTLKIDPDELAVAVALTRHAGPDDFVLAPVGPSHWVGLLHAHPHPLVVREMLLDALADQFDQRELTLRVQLTRMVGGDQRLPRSGKLLTHAIDSVPLHAVALQGKAREWDDVIQALEESPLDRVEVADAFEIWARDHSEPPRAASAERR